MKKAVVGMALAAACTCAAKETILVAADPFAVGLKNAVVKHLEERGFAVKDLGATDANKDKPYFESAVDVCRALQKGEAKRAFLFCGTGMGMSMIANRFKGVRAAVVESVFAANTLSTTAARTPLKRLAIMLMPIPVPQKRNARFASPLWSARHTSTALSK